MLNTYSDLNEVRTVSEVLSEHESYKFSATPILAAIILEPRLVPAMLGKGASPNHIEGTSVSPLACASDPKNCRDVFGLSQNGVSSGNQAFSLMTTLLENGANPDDRHETISVKEIILCTTNAINKSFELTEKKINKIKLLSDYGATFSDEEITRCKEQIQKEIAHYGKQTRSSPERTEFVKEVGLLETQARETLALLDNIKERGLNQSLTQWTVNYRKEQKRKVEEAAERRRLAELKERKRRQKLAAIQSYIDQDASLTSALSGIAQIGAERSTVEWILLQNRFGADECETRVDGAYFKSKACESSAKTLISQIKTHYSTLNSTYQKQRDWFTGLFGKNASFVEEIVDDRVANVGSIDEIKQQYAPAFQQLRRITDTEARAERSARKRQEQQMMAAFMSNIQSTFERTNRMLDRNMARTQQTINQAYASQRSSGNYADSGYQVRSNAPAMRDLDKKLEDIDRSFSTNSGTKDRPDIASSPVKPSHRVCGGPFTVPAMNKVFDIKALNSGKASPPIECSAGGHPIMKGRYNPKAQYINWLMQPPNYKKEAIRNENGRPSGRFRVSWDAFRYECLCSNRSAGQRSESYQQ
ncbi:MAG: hypothetical protein RIK85_05895 [Marinobacter sp.]